MQRAVEQLVLGTLAVADVLEHRHDVRRLLGRVAHERHHGSTPHDGAVAAAEAVLDLAAVGLTRAQRVDDALDAVVGIEIVGERPPVQRARGVVAHLLEHRVGLEDQAVEAERHHPDRRGVEHRAELLLARAECLFRAFAVGDVDHHALPVRDAGRLVDDDLRLLAHPDDAAVARDHAVLGEERRQRRARILVLGGLALPVVRMEHLEPELVLVQPRLARVAHERLDLRADVQRRRMSRVVGEDAVEVGHDAGNALDQALEPAHRRVVHGVVFARSLHGSRSRRSRTVVIGTRWGRP